MNQVLRNETTVAHESSVVITCNASGIPDPELVWKKDSEPVDYTLTSSVPSVDYYTVETLSIESVVPEDSGVYTCIATNQGGTVGASTQLHVVGVYNSVCVMHEDVFGINIVPPLSLSLPLSLSPSLPPFSWCLHHRPTQ